MCNFLHTAQAANTCYDFDNYQLNQKTLPSLGWIVKSRKLNITNNLSQMRQGFQLGAEAQGDDYL